MTEVCSLVDDLGVDPLTFLMHSLQERFGDLGEEVRVQAVTELMSFSRKGNENVDALLVRFDSIRTRAAEQGGAVVSVQGVARLLLRGRWDLGQTAFSNLSEVCFRPMKPS